MSEEQNNSSNAKKGRSPAFPAISLEAAIDLCKTVHTKERMHATTREVMSRTMGYNGVTGSAARALAALKYYGLIEKGEGDEAVKLTALVPQILHPENPTEKRNALRTAALSPKINQELFDKYKDELPSDETLISTLVRKGYFESSAKEAISAYKATIAYLGSEHVELSGDGTAAISKNEKFPISAKEAIGPGAVNQTLGTVGHQRPTNLNASSDETLKYRLGMDCSAEVAFTGPVTQKNIRKLIALLQLNADAYPEDLPVITKPAVDQVAALEDF